MFNPLKPYQAELLLKYLEGQIPDEPELKESYRDWQKDPICDLFYYWEDLVPNSEAYRELADALQRANNAIDLARQCEKTNSLLESLRVAIKAILD